MAIEDEGVFLGGWELISRYNNFSFLPCQVGFLLPSFFGQEEYERDEHKKEPTPKKYFNFSSCRAQCPFFGSLLKEFWGGVWVP